MKSKFKVVGLSYDFNFKMWAIYSNLEVRSVDVQDRTSNDSLLGSKSKPRGSATKRTQSRPHHTHLKPKKARMMSRTNRGS
jgi:hypothetical protein